MSSDSLLMLNTLFGAETTNHGTWKFYGFVMHIPNRDPVREQSLYGMSADDQNPIVIIRKHAMSPKSNRRKELDHWTSASYGAPEGTILKIYGFCSAETRGSRALIVNQLIRLREQAPVNKLSLPLSVGFRQRNNEAHILGRYDLIDISEAESYGLRLDARRKHMLRTPHQDTLNLEVIEQGVAPQGILTTKSVQLEDGTEQTISIRRKRRQIE